MARVLTRPMFRKGGLSQTPRPTYRGGGLTTIRPRYRNGGMNGIMSGIVPRRGYQLGTGDALGSSWAVGPKVEGPEWHEDIYISPITGTLRKREQEPFVSFVLLLWHHQKQGDYVFFSQPLVPPFLL